MNIVVAGVSSTKELSGVSRHTVNLTRCLLGRPEAASVHLVIAQWQYEAICKALPHDDARLHIHTAHLGSSAMSRNWWYYWKFPRLVAQLGADIVHLAYPVPVNRRAFECPTVVTLHDLYPYDVPSNFGFPKVLFNRYILQQCLRAVDAIACVSESTLQRLALSAPQSTVQKSAVIYNCIVPPLPMATKSPLPGWNGEPFLLCVAQHRRNKNIMLALRIFQRLLLNGEMGPTGSLVIVGIEGPETARIHRFIQTAGLSRNVVLLRGIADDELQWCYGHCELLIAPSTVEGFGLPVVEAMLHRCRVVCSDIPAFREVGGGYCHYASLRPSPEDAFIHAIREARKSLKFRAAHTDRFSAARVAEAYIQLYLQLRKHASFAHAFNQSDLLTPEEGETHLGRL